MSRLPPMDDDDPMIGILVPVTATATFAITTTTTDEAIENLAAEYAAAVAKAARETMSRARDAASAASGLAAGNDDDQDDSPTYAPAADLDPISAATRRHPRVRAVYREWFGGRSAND